MSVHSLRLASVLALLVATVACDPKGVETDQPSDSASPDDTAPPDTDGPVVEDLQWELHADFGSIVVVSWEQLREAEGLVRFSVDEGVWLESPTRSLEVGAQQALLLGVPYDSDVTLAVVTDLGESDEVLAHTDVPPDGLPVSSLLVGDESAWDPSMPYVLGSMSWDDAWTVIVDRAGRVVWAYQTDRLFTTLYSQPSFDGAEILVDLNSYWSRYDGGATSEVLRMKIDGSGRESIATPGLHHPFLELEDGSLLWGAADGPTETLEVLDAGGIQTTLWSCSAWQDAIGAEGLCQSNTLFWQESSDSLLYSFWSNDSILEIDRATGAVLRYFGHETGAWGFADGSDPFWWQHGATYTDTGTLLTSTHRAEHDEELVVREYELDHDGEQLVEVWSFGEDQGIEASEMGDALRLPGGNTLHNYGEGTRLREVTPDGTVVWDLDWSPPVYLGKTTPLEDLYALAPE